MTPAMLAYILACEARLENDAHMPDFALLWSELSDNEADDILNHCGRLTGGNRIQWRLTGENRRQWRQRVVGHIRKKYGT